MVCICRCQIRGTVTQTQQPALPLAVYHHMLAPAPLQGMQIQVDQPTIENSLHEAMFSAGCVPDSGFEAFKQVWGDAQCSQDVCMPLHFQVGWSRAARTDRGVSAVGQVVALNMRVDPDPDTVRDAINAHLPSDIRVLGIVRVTKGFDARRVCDKRKYEYWLPLWVLDPQVGREHLLLPPYVVRCCCAV